MSFPDDLEAWLRLGLIPGLSGASFRRLLAEFGSPEAILSASQGSLTRLVTPAIASAICAGGESSALEAVDAWLGDPQNHILTLADRVYPQALLQTPDPPPLLYAKGALELLDRPCLAVVGSRSATPQGVATAETLAAAVSDAGLTVVSGLAVGIDAAAHRGGLAGAASSVAVVATGLDIVYPARNRSLAHELAARGALISEFELGTPARPANFPRRNRLISGLSRGCLVVEAATQSGSLITARLAAEQGREVFAVPGSIHSPLAKGCHLLIKQGAKLVETAQDILEELRLAPVPTSSMADLPQLPRAAQELLGHLGFDPCDLDTLAARTGTDTAALLALLAELEIAGRVAVLPGGRYQRLN